MNVKGWDSMNRVPVFLHNGKVYTFKMCGEYIQKVHNK